MKSSINAFHGPNWKGGESNLDQEDVRRHGKEHEIGDNIRPQKQQKLISANNLPFVLHRQEHYQEHENLWHTENLAAIPAGHFFLY